LRDVLGNQTRTATQAQVIMVLNPILRGWAMYHRHVVAAATFSRIDHLMWVEAMALGQDAAIRRKGMRWIKARYFERHGMRDWVFACATIASLSWPIRPDPLPAGSIAHQAPHEGSAVDANPFDPAWSSYFEQRAHAI
jgi:RNA-directed DNA polymerase